MTVTIMIGDVRDQLRKIPSDSIHCCVTSPPYWGLRDYGVDGQIGLEATPSEFIAVMVEVFEEVRRVLRPDGTCWINMGDSYARDSGKGGSGPGGKNGAYSDTYTKESKVRSAGLVENLKAKDLVMMPHRLAIALQDAGWWVRQDIVWSKPNPMPESVRDRCTKSHEYIFLLTKSAKYYYNAEAIKEPVVKGAAGSEFHTGKTGEHQLGRASTKPRGVGFGHGTDAVDRKRGRVIIPAGWATGSDRAHTELDGNFTEARKRVAAVEMIDAGASARMGRGPGWREKAKGNAKTFRGGGVYTQGASFDNDGDQDRDNHGNTPNIDGLRNKRSVWTMATHSFSEAHFATFPPELPRNCILAGCPPGGTVLDPFFGAGTTGLEADRLQRDCIGIELNPAYAEISRKRIQAESTLLAEIIVA